ncbi:MAG: hypothetical protein K8T89_22810, partial [Planctomycetes bacterium]|nr:hypothetical protein [Planctomycetota bacterium]
MSLPSLIIQRDGRSAPFEPEKLSRSLFAATEALRAPDPFLARELTDGVLHFLEVDSAHLPPTADELIELVVKVVRELGHPALAKVYEERVRAVVSKPSEPASAEEPTLDPFVSLHRTAALTSLKFSLERVYPRDLVSAHQNGLLRLDDLKHPYELAGVVLSPIPVDHWALLKSIVAARRVAGSFIAFDGVEYAVADCEGSPEAVVTSFRDCLDESERLTGLHAILNLNVATLPAWAAQAGLGPLFPDEKPSAERNRLDRIALLLLEQAKGQTVFWHLSEKDFADTSQLNEIVRRVVHRSGVEFVFDRPRRPVVLGPGLDRQSPATLGIVGIDLPRFVEHLGGGQIEPDLFQQKLATLARFAKTAGHARQDFLRQHGRPELFEGFLLERAVEIVLPIGGIAAVRRSMNQPSDWEAIIQHSAQTLKSIQHVLEIDQLRPMTTR